MKITRPSRIAITSGAAVLCLGVAAPSVAYACAGEGSGSAIRPDTAAASQFGTPTLQQEQSWIDSFVSHRTAWLDHLSAVVTADPNLTADQQAKALDSIGKAKAALADLKSAVDAATSTAQVHDIVRAALASMPAPWWPGPMMRHGAFHHHPHKFAHRGDRTQGASPTDVSARSAGIRATHYTAWSSRDGRRDSVGAQHWSHPGDRGGDWSGDEWAGHHDGGGHGGWGR